MLRPGPPYHAIDRHCLTFCVELERTNGGNLPRNLDIPPPVLHNLEHPAANCAVSVVFLSPGPVHEVLEGLGHVIQALNQGPGGPERFHTKNCVHNSSYDAI